MLDEFELVEIMINEGALDKGLLGFWRGLIEVYPWLIMVFAGLHTLAEMTEDYWNPLYGSVINLRVSFLNSAATRRLITQPTPDFPLDYDPGAIAAIETLTFGQPYLVQLICHELVTVSTGRPSRRSWSESAVSPWQMSRRCSARRSSTRPEALISRASGARLRPASPGPNRCSAGPGDLGDRHAGR